MSVTRRNRHRTKTGESYQGSPQTHQVRRQTNEPARHHAQTDATNDGHCHRYTPAIHLEARGPFVVRGVPVLTFFNLDEAVLLKERFLEVRVPTP